jgi:predicted 2-oxoglutarate/Fe(II)-dependent dioxygenase YbiX
MKLINYGYGILVFEDFLNKEEVAIIQSACFDTELWKHTEDFVDVSKPFVDNVLSVPFDHPAHEILVNANKRVGEIFPVYGTRSQQTGAQINRFKPEDAENNDMDVAMQLHHDKQNEYFVNGVVYYFNDNYEGGEIEYPDHNVVIKPKAGMLVTHPAELNHYVRKFSGGPRFFATNFICQTEFETDDLGYRVKSDKI